MLHGAGAHGATRPLYQRACHPTSARACCMPAPAPRLHLLPPTHPRLRCLCPITLVDWLDWIQWIGASGHQAWVVA